MVKFLSLALLAFTYVSMPAFANENNESAMVYLNQLRMASGLQPLHHNKNLSRAAQAHADYLLRNNYRGHGESSSSAGFTGRSPSERAITAGFPSRVVLENIHYSYGDHAQHAALYKKAIDGLMTAIYHRAAFLNFGIDLVGVGQASNQTSSVIVFVMGNAAEAELCRASQPQTGQGSFYSTVCSNKKKKVAADLWESATESTQQSHDAWVMWPYEGGRGVTPAFSNEEPDPLPDIEVSGNPISVYFNPALAKSIVVKSFLLFDADGHKLDVRLMDQQRDPHQKFSALQAAIFPLQRLQWNSTYTAELNARVDGREQKIRWSFHTEDLAMPMYTAVKAAKLNLPAQDGRFAIYIPPQRGGVQVIESVSSSYRNIRHLKYQLHDSNTLLFDVAGIRSHSSIQIRAGRNFTFTILFKKRQYLGSPIP